MRAGALVVAGVCAALLSGCGLGARVLSSPGEYEAYRATRAEYTAEARLRAAQRYLGGYPEGRFVDEVRGRFEAEETAFYRARRRSRQGLEEYVQVLPQGPHASEASLQLLEFERQAAQQRSDELLAQGRTIERRLGRAADSRKATVDALVGWIAALSSNDRWGRTTWEQPAELIRALRTEPDPGRCDERQCVRSQTMTFQIPIAGGGLEERAATFDRVLRLERGLVRGGALRGPALFSRFYEAARGRPLPADPLEARAEAVSHALEVIAGAFEAVVPGGRCERGIQPPVVWRRECDGWRVVVTAGDQPADDDALEVEGPREAR